MAKVGDISRAARAGSDTLATADNYVNDEDLPRLRARTIPADSVLFAKIGEAIRQNYRLLTVRPMLIDNNVMAAIPREAIYPRFLFHYLRTIDLFPLATSTSVPSLRKSELEKVPCPLPSLEEQRRIAKVLDIADRIRAVRRRFLSESRFLAQSYFAAMFDTTDEGAFVSLGSIVVPGRPITYGILKPGPEVPDGVPYVRVVDIDESGIRSAGVRRTSHTIAAEYRRSTLEPGDVVMSIRGHVGRLAIVPQELGGGNITQDSARLAIHDFEARYVVEAIRSARVQMWLRKHVKGVAVQGINLADVRRILIPDAPLARQREFSRRARGADSVVAKAGSHLAAADALFASLQQRAFAGAL